MWYEINRMYYIVDVTKNVVETLRKENPTKKIHFNDLFTSDYASFQKVVKPKT